MPRARHAKAAAPHRSGTAGAVGFARRSARRGSTSETAARRRVPVAYPRGMGRSCDRRARRRGRTRSTRGGARRTRRPPVMRFEIRPPEGQVLSGCERCPEVRGVARRLSRRIRVDSARPARSAVRPPIRRARATADQRHRDPGQRRRRACNSRSSRPTGRFVAFFSGVESALKRVPVAGGPVERLATLTAQNCSGRLAWRRHPGGMQRAPRASSG